MSIHVALEHRTTYRFDRPVGLGPHVVRLRPAPHCRTPILAYSLRVEPGDHFTNWQQDPFGNHLARLVFPEKVRELDITVDLVADMTVINPLDFFLDEEARHIGFAYDAALAEDLAPYRRVGAPGPGVAALLRQLDVPVAGSDPTTEVGTVDALAHVNGAVQSRVGSTVRMEPGVHDPEETLTLAEGSCRDSAWLLVEVLRHLGLAARFASGYLVQLTADVTPLDGPAGPSADFTDLHAWTEVFLPGAGWVGLDPTSGLFAGEGHIPLACTPDPGTAAPIAGATEPAEVTFSFHNTVTRIHEDPRVTKPHTPEQWSAIDALGREVDGRLAAGDVRLTMGGEPTFVADDDRESPEWTTAADGPEKRRRSALLADRLADRWAPGGLIQHGQGKWYPGEVLPRWQIAILWRPDGQPLRLARSLLADTSAPGGATPADAETLVRAIAARLGLAPERPMPAYEDPLVALQAEAALPEGDPPELDVDVDDPALGEPDRRRELVTHLDATAGRPTGWVLPLAADPRVPVTESPRWISLPWELRRGRIVLIPGDSPVGLRLPLAALSWRALPAEPPRSPFESRAPLAPRVEATATSPDPTRRAETAPASEPEPHADEVPPTAVSVEVRDGHVRVFLPPLERAEHTVALLAAIERAAAATGVAVAIEGYPPPSDPRITRLMITPDPGVIEVNVHPSGSWPELVATTTELHEAARECQLTTETFMLDGTHTGTGGGNHLTLGGPTPADSPLLRRPDLVRSIITYWQHHPSLSYLFSGRFIGPTSQAPRVDEGRDEALYELEIAFSEMDRLGADVAPWIVDRLLRHLLTDVTGNTHRAELCIDKLFSPDGERGRLGLLELRGFEMPPHPEMALVQALMVRSLVARFWDEPYRAPLVRWGTELHDRFLLPHWVEADIADVVDDLRAHGIAFDPAWLGPFLEFRFPRIGAITAGGVGVELRAAIEPWAVLGEEVSSSGTSRYVDSSVERLQVTARDVVADRHVVTCNGIPVPLRPTGRTDTLVGAVRYKAWQPPSSLHPTIEAHTPLVFDVVDRWNGRSLGGCRHHVAHPGGRSYDRLPVNSNEAEARRVSRFETIGHRPGPVDPSTLDLPARDRAAQDYPRTLDLRRHPAPPTGPIRRRQVPSPMTASPSPDLLRGYDPDPTSWDALVAAGGEPRPAWEKVAGTLTELGLDELRDRRHESERLLDEDGVSYTTVRAGDGRRAGHRWALDPVPALLTSDEWAAIERGVVERSELLNLILTDLYGPRDLLRTGVLPPQMVWSDPGFLRPCDGITLPGPAQLVTAGFDLVRGADGEPQVLNDRAQAPAGPGFALQNREVTSRVFPSLYRDSEVHRLAPFLRALRLALLNAAPPGIDDPRVVVLSPGPLSRGAFEHAFLARHLGCALVEGADLTVRRGRVWLRSLGRLEPVHVILRRLDAAFCDPVELRPDSQLGVPGLLEACRRGTVSVANPLGTSVLENPALAAYLPRAAEALLGHDLALPSVPAWWCGEDGPRAHVLANLHDLVLRQAGRDPDGQRSSPIDGSTLTRSERDDLAARIEAEPLRWTGTARVELSTTPTLTHEGLRARPSVLRTFTVSRGDSYAVMPGGLTRVAPTSAVRVSHRTGAIAKDTWVLASEPERLTGFWLQSGPAVEAVAPEGSMSSRAAENLFWLGRYAERSEGLIRLLATVGDRRNEFAHGANPAGRECLAVLLHALTRVSGTAPGFSDPGDPHPSAPSAADLEVGAELRSVVVDVDRPGSLAYDARRLIDAAQAVRDQLSSDTWPALSALERELLGPAAASYPRGVGRSTLSEVLQALLALAGLGAESMERDPGWQFMEAGRRLERALHLTELLRATVTVARDVASDSLLFESVLTATESIITYRRRYRSHAQLETLLDLLLLDPDNPRSLAHQTRRLEAALAALPDADPSGSLTPAQRFALEASTAVRLADTRHLATADAHLGAPDRRLDLDAFLTQQSDRLRATADALSRAHFAPVVPQRAMAGSHLGGVR